VGATVYELQKLRCHLCGEIFTATPPPEVGPEKYDAASAGMIALLKYGTGMPFNRLERLQGDLGIPLPAATQWDIVEESGDRIEPAGAELIRQAAQGQVFHNDDTRMKILALLNPAYATTAAELPDRKNAYFYKTDHGARVGDLFMSLIHTCELNNVNPFDYLTQLLEHPNELAAHPADWMPWNYQQTLQRLAAPQSR